MKKIRIWQPNILQYYKAAEKSSCIRIHSCPGKRAAPGLSKLQIPVPWFGGGHADTQRQLHSPVKGNCKSRYIEPTGDTTYDMMENNDPHWPICTCAAQDQSIGTLAVLRALLGIWRDLTKFVET